MLRSTAQTVIDTVSHTMLWVTASNNDSIAKNFAFDSNLAILHGLGKDGIVIYCVHGTGDKALGFRALIDFMNNEGLSPLVSEIILVSFHEVAPGSSVEDFSGALNHKILSNKHTNIILFGHSRGGLVAAKTALFGEETKLFNILLALFICSPFRGSWWAMRPVTWFSSSVDQMQVGSNHFLQALADEIKASKVKFVYYGADQDFIVTKEQACIEGQVCDYVFPELGHISVMHANGVGKKVVALVNHHLTELYTLEENEAACLKYLVNSNDPAFLALSKVTIEIADEIARLTRDGNSYQKSPALKITVLSDLLSMLNAIKYDGKGDDFSEANTIGEFIDAYLKQYKVEDKTAQAILTESLNNTWGIFSPRSQAFIEGLIKKFQQTPLLQKPTASNKSKCLNSSPF